VSTSLANPPRSIYDIAVSIDTPFHVDCFAGGGGASEGWERATGIPVGLAINHDRMAIAMHRANHPHTRHLRENIMLIDPMKACRGRRPNSAWFSPDCKHFSKAKGGKPRDKFIRMLAWVVIHWVNEVRPGIIYLENVEEFQDWGPLLKNGQPNKRWKRWFFRCFIGALRRRGYEVEWREIRCSTLGAPTIRKRLFLIARCDGRPIVFPEATHAPAGPRAARTAAECIDFTLPCPSIFLGRRAARKLGLKRPLVAASCRRIARGVERFVMKAQRPFLVSLTHQGNDGVEGVAEPFRTITGAHRGEKAMVQPRLAPFITEHANASTQRNFSADEPLRTQCASVKGGHFAVVASSLARQFGTGVGSEMGKPMPTVMADGGGKTLLVSAYLAQHNGGMVGHAAAEPVSTINGKGANQALVAAALVKYYGTEQAPRLDESMPTVTTKDRMGLVEAFCDVPLLTLEKAEMARRVARFLRRHGVKVEGEFAMCGEYVIYDLGMRMLMPRELFRAQSFGDDYIIDRGVDELDDGSLVEIPLTKTAQVRMCGNSVCPVVAEALIRANQPEIALKEIAA